MKQPFLALLASLAMGLTVVVLFPLAHLLGVHGRLGFALIELGLLAPIGIVWAWLGRNDPVLGSTITVGVGLIVVFGATGALGLAMALLGDRAIGAIVLAVSACCIGAGVLLHRRSAAGPASS